MTSDCSTDKFRVLSFSGPFESLCRKKGRLKVLKDTLRVPEKLGLDISNESNRLLNSIKLILKKGVRFDAAWIWSDLAHKDNLFFSPKFYKKYLFPLHKKIIRFLNNHNMPVIFHSDGKIDKLIPYFLKAGVAVLYPLDKYANMDIPALKKRYEN